MVNLNTDSGFPFTPVQICSVVFVKFVRRATWFDCILHCSGTEADGTLVSLTMAIRELQNKNMKN
jgi:hypothetical protein